MRLMDDVRLRKRKIMAKTILNLKGIEELESDSAPVVRLKNQLSKGFNPNKSGDTKKLLILVSYMYALDQHELVKIVLKQIYAYAKFDSNKIYLWYDYGSFLIFMAELSSSQKKKDEFLSPVLVRDIYGGDESRLENYFEFSGEIYQDDAVVASFETQKVQCEYMSGHITQLLYFKHMLSDEDRNNGIEKEIELMLENSIKYLRLFLCKKTPFKPMEFFNGLPDRVRGAGLDAVSRYMKALKYNG